MPPFMTAHQVATKVAPSEAIPPGPLGDYHEFSSVKQSTADCFLPDKSGLFIRRAADKASFAWL